MNVALNEVKKLRNSAVAVFDTLLDATGGMSALGAALFSIGIPKDSILNYETSLRANKFILIANGTTDEIAHAQHILSVTKAAVTAVHNG
jgi:cytochrome c biogenesis protein ResB